MNDITNIEFEFGVKSVFPVTFYLNEKVTLAPQLNLGYGLETTFDENDDLVTLILTAQYTDVETNIIVFNGKVATVFLVKQLKRFINNDQLDIPGSLAELLFSISFSHTRAILCTYTNGTNLNGLVLPIINPGLLLKQILESVANNQGGGPVNSKEEVNA